MKEIIRRIKERKTWVNPTGWELARGRWLILVVSFYLFSLITLLRSEIQLSIALLSVAIFLTLIYIGIQRQLRKRFNDIEDKFGTSQPTVVDDDSLKRTTSFLLRRKRLD